jgi:hypothetical protein
MAPSSTLFTNPRGAGRGLGSDVAPNTNQAVKTAPDRAILASAASSPAPLTTPGGICTLRGVA